MEPKYLAVLQAVRDGSGKTKTQIAGSIGLATSQLNKRLKEMGTMYVRVIELGNTRAGHRLELTEAGRKALGL